MADDVVPGLSQADKEKIVAWLKERGAPKACAACGQNNWQLAAHLVSPLTHSGGGLSLGGMNYPQAMLICMNCSHTIYFNAVVMGVKSSVAEEKPNG